MLILEKTGVDGLYLWSPEVHRAADTRSFRRQRSHSPATDPCRCRSRSPDRPADPSRSTCSWLWLLSMTPTPTNPGWSRRSVKLRAPWGGGKPESLEQKQVEMGSDSCQFVKWDDGFGVVLWFHSEEEAWTQGESRYWHRLKGTGQALVMRTSL